MISVTGRIIRNLEIAVAEMRSNSGSAGHDLVCEEAAKVLTLLDVRLALLARSSSSETTKAAAFQMREIIRGEAIANRRTEG